jgi:hypothetical protein
MVRKLFGGTNEEQISDENEPGQRWLHLTNQFGQLSIGLIPKNWLIDRRQWLLVALYK